MSYSPSTNFEIKDEYYEAPKLEQLENTEENVILPVTEIPTYPVDIDTYCESELTQAKEEVKLENEIKEENESDESESSDNEEYFVPKKEANDNLDLDSSGEEESQEENAAKPHNSSATISKGQEKVMNDIFGDSEEEEDFEGFEENEIDKEAPVKEVVEVEKRPEKPLERIAMANRDSSPVRESGDILSVWENIMKEQRIIKQMNRPKRRNDVEFLNDMDDRIADLMNKMRLAAIEDEELYHLGQPGVKKMMLLPAVKDILRRQTIKEALIESKFLVVMATWLKPLPHHVLPPLDIRKTLLTALQDFPSLSGDVLKESNIGKAVMYLYKHPRETPENRKIAGNLIDEWSRPIFNLSSNYNGMSREERLERDRSIVNRRRLVDNDASSKKEVQDESERATKPGDEGWIPRATVPKQSNKDYIIRPNWKIGDSRRSLDDDDDDDNDNVRMVPSRKRARQVQNPSSTNNWERTFRRIKEAGKQRKMVYRAANISIQGRGLGI